MQSCDANDFVAVGAGVTMPVWSSMLAKIKGFLCVSVALWP
jgi:hypothetical protein